jgi:hypothetical protein
MVDLRLHRQLTKVMLLLRNVQWDVAGDEEQLTNQLGWIKQSGTIAMLEYLRGCINLKKNLFALLQVSTYQVNLLSYEYYTAHHSL